MPYVQQRRGTASALASANEIPLAGQLVVETDTGKMKVGNGTTAYAGLEYITDASNIANESISTNHLATGAITTGKVADLNVTAAKLADDAVTTRTVADNAITNAHLQDSTVNTAEIANDAVTFAKMQDVSANSLLGAVNAGDVTQIVCRQIGRDILDDSTAADVRSTIGAAPTVIDTTSLADDAVTNAKIAQFAVDTQEIAAGAVETGKLDWNAVTYAKFQQVGAEKVLGNSTTSSGNVEELPSTIFGRSLLNSASSNALATTLGVATTSQITAAINNVIDAAPGALDTLNELAAAIGDDASFSTNVTNSIAAKLPLAGGTVTGDVDMQRSASSATKIDWGNSNGGNFSSTATDLDYVRLYTSGTTVAGMGITTSNFNIGTNGAINVSMYAAGVLNERKTGTLSRHYVNQFYNAPIYTAGGSATLPVISKEGDPDTGIYYPSLGAFAITADGDEKVKVTNNQITVSRTAGYPTIKADATGVNGSAGGWMIIDSSTNNCALNYYSSADVSLAYGGGGVSIGTVALGSYKFRVHGGQAHFSQDVIIGSGAVYSPVYRADTSGSLTNNAYSRSSDGDTGMYFPDANKVALTAGGVEFIRGATTGSSTVVSSSHLIDTSNFIYANGYRAKNAGSPAATAFGRYNDGNTGIYFPATDQLAISTGGTTALRISSAGSIAIGSHAPTDSYVIYIAKSKTEQPSFQGIASVPSHAYGQAGTFNTIGVNGSALLTASANSIANSGYIRGLHGAGTYYSRDGSSVAEVTGVHGLAQHASASGGDGTVNTGYGVKGYYYESNPGGTTATAFGVKANVNLTSNADATSTISNAYAMYTGVNSSYSGRILNGYGLYISVVEAANAWGIYQDSALIKNRFYGTVEHGGTTGSAGSYIPGITFLSDPNTGFGKNASAGDVIDVITGGNIVGDFRTTGIRMINGTSSECAYAFQEDADTGMFRDTSTGLNLQWAGSGLQIASAHINAEKKMLFPAGTQAAPSIAQAGNDDTGISFGSVGANQINLNVAGGAKISINPTATYLAGTVQFNGSITDGTTTKTAAQLMAKIAESPPPSVYGQNLLFG